VPDEEAVDRALLARIAAGDRTAFRALVVAHSAAVGRYLRVFAPDVGDDALQEAFLAAWRHAGQFGDRGSVRGWLMTTGRRAALRLRSREVASEELSSEPGVDALGEAAGWGRASDPAAFARALESRELLHRGLEALSTTDREAIVLVDVLGHEYDEACAVTGLGLGAFKSRLHRARLRLIAALRAHVPEVSHEG
jgi:RNA polymerase sigma-70 factor, ECF subfamily